MVGRRTLFSIHYPLRHSSEGWNLGFFVWIPAFTGMTEMTDLTTVIFLSVVLRPDPGSSQSTINFL
jgi:hypothetical protein